MVIHKPIKGLGQNFLKSKAVIKRIVDEADLKKGDLVLEIGPGKGALTRELSKKAKVIAVEKDKRLVELLKKELKDVEIIEGDILKVKLSLKNYKIVSNLPYHISKQVLKKFLETENQPKEMILMVQKEVGQSICSKPPHMSKLGVFCKLFSEPKIIKYISKEAFSPKPKVDSALLRISKIRKPDVDLKLFSKIVNLGFSHKRKTLLNNLSGEKEKVRCWLEKNNINPNQRAESLLVDNWIDLTKTSFVG